MDLLPSLLVTVTVESDIDTTRPGFSCSDVLVEVGEEGRRVDVGRGRGCSV